MTYFNRTLLNSEKYKHYNYVDIWNYIYKVNGKQPSRGRILVPFNFQLY
jgi:hypothetical protein